jgi:ABC-2 type transport system permease protein
MRPYLAVFVARFRTLLQYRAAALGGLGTQTFFGLVRIMILEGFYRSTQVVPALSFPEVVVYVWLGQATFAMQPYNLDRDVRNMVQNGTIAYELVRPLDLYTFWYWRALAWRSAPMLLRLLPMLLLVVLLPPLLGFPEWGMRAPAGPAAAAGWVLTTLGGLAVSTAITALMSVLMVWTLSGEGLSILLGGIVSLLSGMVLPLPLFPDWAQPVLRALPFSALVDYPARIYTGDLPVSEVGWLLLHQALWTVALALLGAGLLRRATRRLVVQGG